jgi:hypothetical protein
MYKKIIITSMAMAAFAAFAMSAAASAASPVLTTAAGGVVPVGEGLKATNVGFSKIRGGEFVVLCSNDVLTGRLTANPNNGNPVEATVEHASFSGGEPEEDCSSGLGRVQVTTAFANGTPYCASFRASDVLQVRGGSCNQSAHPITFVLDVHSVIGVIQCHFERTAATGPLFGTYTTNPSAAVGFIVSGANSRFVGTSGGLCPTTGELEMTFELRTAAGGLLTID